MNTDKAAGLRAVGRRKEAAARIRILSDSTAITVNGKPLEKYFTYFVDRQTVESPLKQAGLDGVKGVSAKVVGGGTKGQAEAIRHGIARALVAANEELRKTMKALGFLRRDPRMKERKKFGLKRARRAPQWSKR